MTNGAQPEVPTEPPARLRAQPVLSQSGQFYVYCSDHNWSVRFVGYADAVRQFVCQQIGVASAEPGNPILIIVHDEAAPAQWRGKSQLSVKPVEGAQTYFMLHLFLPMESQTVLAALVESVAVEASQRGKKWDPNAASAPRPPLWWTQGAAETFREDLREPHQQTLARVWSESAPTPASKLVCADAMPEDTLERRYFIAQCGVLFRALADSPDGDKVIAEILRRATLGENPDKAFRAATETKFSDERALEKWWALHCAAQTRLTAAGFMSSEDSLQTLQRLLLFEIAQKDGNKPPVLLTLGVEQLDAHHKQPEVRWLIRERVTQLRLFATQTHPFFKPAALSYADALDSLSSGKAAAFRSRLRDAEQWRAQAESYDRRAHDWMSEVESELRGDAGRLLPFLGEFERARALDRQRTNQIKKYLDEVEKESSR